ncbi:hypothetical protein [Chryseobacterium herbae]|uniref:FAD-binding FR-type domain-containing protein n=1 Tax=Chryseobacterium herbae TaxID=2976476 RepID=A0ABT2IZH2_9FLAO|nr:hypothetical protein [Chryseobacterium sp. pc1-10]MCT2563891.1 hypothetical protein [Chryseobacterium sp. pc1-10]
MNSQTQSSDFFSAIILSKNKIAENTFHIRIQSRDFSQIQYAAGYTAEIFLSDPHYNPDSEIREYAFWNYEPVFHTADFAIHTDPMDQAVAWIETVQEGDSIFFRKLSDELTLDDSGSHYFLIGDVKALAYLYEINRALAVSKKVDSLIYAERNEEVFPDLDHSFPLISHVINPLKPEKIGQIIKKKFPASTENTIVYMVGNSEISLQISNYIQGNPAFEIRKIYMKKF